MANKKGNEFFHETLKRKPEPVMGENYVIVRAKGKYQATVYFYQDEIVFMKNNSTVKTLTWLEVLKKLDVV
jgi:hypothetical protein